MAINIGRKSTILQCGTQRTINFSMSTEPRSRLLILGRSKTHTPLYIGEAEVEQVNSFRFLRISIAEYLVWSSHITTVVKKAHQTL